MKDEPEQPSKDGFFVAAKTDVDRVRDAIEAWYADHFRRAAVAGRAPISADEKSELTQAITAAVTPSEH